MASRQLQPQPALGRPRALQPLPRVGQDGGLVLQPAAQVELQEAQQVRLRIPPRRPVGEVGRLLEVAAVPPLLDQQSGQGRQGEPVVAGPPRELLLQGRHRLLAAAGLEQSHGPALGHPLRRRVGAADPVGELDGRRIPPLGGGGADPVRPDATADLPDAAQNQRHGDGQKRQQQGAPPGKRAPAHGESSRVKR